MTIRITTVAEGENDQQGAFIYCDLIDYRSKPNYVIRKSEKIFLEVFSDTEKSE
jgi:hypothetical protein